MITVCVMFAAKGSVASKIKMAVVCLSIDSIYIIPFIL